MSPVLQSAFGFVAILLLAWLASENRRVVAWRTVIAGIALQIVFAAALLKLAIFKQFFLALNDVLLAIEKATQAGTSFVFGYIGGAPLPFAESGPGSSFSLAFRALPMPIVTVVGDRSPDITHRIAGAIAAHAPRASVMTLAKANHALTTTHVEAVAEVIAGIAAGR